MDFWSWSILIFFWFDLIFLYFKKKILAFLNHITIAQFWCVWRVVSCLCGVLWVSTVRGFFVGCEWISVRLFVFCSLFCVVFVSRLACILFSWKKKSLCLGKINGSSSYHLLLKHSIFFYGICIYACPLKSSPIWT